MSAVDKRKLLVPSCTINANMTFQDMPVRTASFCDLGVLQKALMHVHEGVQGLAN